MEIKDIQNWHEIEQHMENMVKDINVVITGTEQDLFVYFQSIKEMNSEKPIICPYCEKKFSQIEVGLEPQKTMDDWEREERTEDHAMSFEDFRKHIATVLGQQIVYMIHSIHTKPSALANDMDALKTSVDSITLISGRLHQLSLDLENADPNMNKDDLINMMTKVLEDIRKTIANVPM